MSGTHARKRRRSAVVAGVAAVSTVLGSGSLWAPAAQAKATAPAPAAQSSRVIVLLNSASAESGLVTKVKQAGGTKVVAYKAVASFAATVSADEAAVLATDPSVAAVIPDSTVAVRPPDATQSVARTAAPKLTAKAASVPGNVCPKDPKKPLVEPEALATTKADKVHAGGITGAGVTVAYIADGVDPNNPDFQRANGQKVFKSYVDFSGEGTSDPTSGAEAFGDASAIAAQGRQVYDVANYVNPTNPLPAGCNIRVLGMAPGASIVGIKAGGELLPNSAILQAIDYAISNHVDVLNESFGANTYSDNNARDTIQRFNDAAVSHGVTVTVSTGDAGVTGTQGTPSTDPKVISTAASTDFQNYQQTGYGAAKFAKPGKWADSNISALSSGGVSQGGQVPDLVAPGEADWALCSTDTANFVGCGSYKGDGSGAGIQAFGGTSQSAPLTAGAAALVIQAYRTTHHGSSPSPALVKKFITSTAHDLGLPGDEQGAGLLDAQAAVNAAKAYKGADPAAHQQFLVSTDQVKLTGKPGAAKKTTVTVTNTGSKKLKLTAGTRDYRSTGGGQTTVNLNPAALPTFPYATNGQTWVYKKVAFKVAKGQRVLDVSTAWQGHNTLSPQDGNSLGPVVRLTVIDPHGVYEANSRPQGASVSPNHAYVDIRYPAAGTWTAILYTPGVGVAQSYQGKVIVAHSTKVKVARGSVSANHLTLKPGQRKKVTLHTHIGGSNGDSVESITLASANQRTSVPVVLRPIIPISKGKGTFAGTITGGNARALAPTQTQTYAFDVPKGRHDLSVGLKLNKDPSVVVEALLLDPDGELIGSGSNVRSFDANMNARTAATLTVTQANPVPGRWRVVVLVVNPVSGKEISQGFSGAIHLNMVKVASKLPTSAKTALAAGKARMFSIKFSNNGAAPVPLQVDPRRKYLTNVNLYPLAGSPTIDLPLLGTSTKFPPYYLVPPGTQSLSATAQSTVASQLELSGPAYMPDVFGAKSTTSTARVTEDGGRHVVARGFWGTYVQAVGPFGTEQAPSGTATVGAVARTQAFDKAVTTAVGDPYSLGVTGDTGGTPKVIKAGKSGTISVTITPNAAKGQVVHGVLYLVTAPVNALSPLIGLNPYMGAVQTVGDVLAAIPYTYTVG